MLHTEQNRTAQYRVQLALYTVKNRTVHMCVIYVAYMLHVCRAHKVHRRNSAIRVAHAAEAGGYTIETTDAANLVGTFSVLASL